VFRNGGAAARKRLLPTRSPSYHGLVYRTTVSQSRGSSRSRVLFAQAAAASFRPNDFSRSGAASYPRRRRPVGSLVTANARLHADAIAGSAPCLGYIVTEVRIQNLF
jgi:hypothetical protein